MNRTQAIARSREAELKDEWSAEIRNRRPVGDIATLWPILKPDPLVADLRPLDAPPPGFLQRLWSRWT
ncbi:MAG: hypothetical protein R2991_07635 [Thermoanaerobaculia bacterium]